MVPGFNASAVYTGTDAIDFARSTKPDLIISDVVMPDMSGIEAAIHIRGFLPACKILLFSGQAATADLLATARGRGYELRSSPNLFTEGSARKIEHITLTRDETISRVSRTFKILQAIYNRSHLRNQSQVFFDKVKNAKNQNSFHNTRKTTR